MSEEENLNQDSKVKEIDNNTKDLPSSSISGSARFLPIEPIQIRCTT
jgi:hypothetical protein